MKLSSLPAQLRPLIVQLRTARQRTAPAPYCDSLSQARQEAARYEAEARAIERQLGDIALVQLAAEEAGVEFLGRQDAGQRSVWMFQVAGDTGTSFTVPAQMIPSVGILTSHRDRLAAAAQADPAYDAQIHGSQA